MISTLKRSINTALRVTGYELKKTNKEDFRQINKKSTPPKIFDDVIEALHYKRGGTQASFYCPLHQCVQKTGLNFSRRGWHPFTETLKEYKENHSLSYRNSSLKKFYDSWKPDSAAKAYVGFNETPVQFRSMPPHLFHLTPWSSRSVKRMDRIVKRWHKADDIEHGKPHFTIEEHGYRDFGPVAPERGKLELLRLVNVYRSIEERAYDRTFGDINVLVLKRGSEFRFMNKGGGYHRTAAMAALGFDQIPATFFNPWIISIDDIDYWPQVRNGNWNRENAAKYFNHLFDFDSRLWALSKGLCGE